MRLCIIRTEVGCISLATLSPRLLALPMSCTPLVIVEGFLSGSGAISWGKFEEHLNRDSTKPRRVLFATYIHYTIVLDL